MHAVNVFVPLVDMSSNNGPTEFVPGSHLDYELKARLNLPIHLAAA